MTYRLPPIIGPDHKPLRLRSSQFTILTTDADGYFTIQARVNRNGLLPTTSQPGQKALAEARRIAKVAAALPTTTKTIIVAPSGHDDHPDYLESI